MASEAGGGEVEVDGAGDEPGPEGGDGGGVEGEQVPEVKQADGLAAERGCGTYCRPGSELMLHFFAPRLSLLLQRIAYGIFSHKRGRLD